MEDEDIDWEFLNLAWDLEKVWLRSQARHNDKELLEIFPEAKGIIPEKIQEWGMLEKEVIEKIRQRLIEIKSISKDESVRWFWREWLKINEGQELIIVGGHITRLKRFLQARKGRHPKGWFTQEEIKQARDVPIESVLVDCKFKRSGRNLVSLCPLHQEKTPSFYVYTDSNSFYCYGCQEGGNIIKLVQLIHGFNFVEAMRWLINK